MNNDSGKEVKISVYKDDLYIGGNYNVEEKNV
jgi:hypothetical protein